MPSRPTSAKSSGAPDRLGGRETILRQSRRELGRPRGGVQSLGRRAMTHVAAVESVPMRISTRSATKR